MRDRLKRVSFPFFYDPDFAATMTLIDTETPKSAGEARWDGENLQDYSGTYGEYLSAKVGLVFPDLKRAAGAR